MGCTSIVFDGLDKSYHDASFAHNQLFSIFAIMHSRPCIFNLQLLTKSAKWNSVHGPSSARHCLLVANASAGSRP